MVRDLNLNNVQSAELARKPEVAVWRCGWVLQLDLVAEAQKKVEGFVPITTLREQNDTLNNPLVSG